MRKKERAITTDTHHHHLKELHDSQKHKQKQNETPKIPQMQKPPQKSIMLYIQGPQVPPRTNAGAVKDPYGGTSAAVGRRVGTPPWKVPARPKLGLGMEPGNVSVLIGIAPGKDSEPSLGLWCAW
jgi:hypothetical protein